MSYVDAFALGSGNEEFIHRCYMALLDVCADVMSEPESTAGHAYRAGLAQNIMAKPAESAANMAMMAAASGELTGSSTDVEIYNSLVAHWDAYAGVPVPDPI